MNIALRFLEHAHGHIGWLAALALVHPAILLRRPRRRALLVGSIATLLATVAAVMGAVMYPSYRTQIKPVLFAEAPSIGWAFERKEHLATAAVLLAWVGLAAHFAARRTAATRGQPDSPADDPPRLARIAHGAYVAAAICALVTASLGIAVACQRSFQ
jgi:hypothetical protein